MADVTISDTKFYAVVPGQPVEINIRIGDGQSGGTSLMFDGEPRAAVEEWEQVGSDNEDVSFRILHCVTTVRDVNEASNHTSVTYTLRGGVEEESFPYDMVVSEGGIARYVIDFAFIN